jgi:hypothetical protein
MVYRRRTSIIFIVLLTASVRTAAQSPVPTPVDFAFPQHIAPECDNIFVVGDLMPPVRSLLSSEAVARLTTTGNFADLLARGGVDPSQALAIVEQNSAYVPGEAAIAFRSAAYDQLIAAVKTALALSLCNGATDAGGAAVDEELPKLQALLLETVRQLDLPEFTLWVRFRDPRIAERAFAAVQQFVPALGERSGLHVEEEENSIHLKFTMGEVMPAEAFPAMLVGAGMAPDPDDPDLAAIGEVLANFEAEIWFERLEDGLRVVVGPRLAQDASYPTEALGPLWRPDSTLLAYGKWRITAFKAGMSEVEDIWENWRDTAAGKAVRSFDDEDLLGDLTRIADDASRSADAGALQVTLGDALEAVIHEQGAHPAEPLADSSVLALIPRDVEAAAVTSAASLADHIYGMLSGFEDRLSRQSIRAELRDEAEQVEMTERMTEFYYGRLGEFRRLALDGSRQAFAPPLAVLGGSRGEIKRLEIAFDDADGERNRVTLTNAPMLEYAAIANLADADRGKSFPNDLARAFFSAYSDDVPASLVEPRDLGLGVETLAFSGAVFDRLPNNLAVAVEGDLVPHYFVIDDWLVFSTSARLSKTILAAHGGSGMHREPPTIDDGALVAFGFFPADLAATYMEHLGKVLGDLARGAGMVELEGSTVKLIRTDHLDSMVSAFPAIAEAIRLVDAVEWTSVDRDNLRETRLRASFAD